jgi:Raf kinase inhibitor-like YbhB/YbcL family protein
MIRMIITILAITFSFVSVQAQQLDSIMIYSTSFFPNDTLLLVSSCDGEDQSPSLRWKGHPENTQSFAIIADDPDAPNGTWVHWVVYDIPRNITSLEANMGAFEIMYHGSKHGINDFGTKKFGGPCPPKGHGAHRYYFKIYALDTMLNLEPGKTKAELLEAMEGHIVARGTIMGYYERK